jgi:hypothetical protein
MLACLTTFLQLYRLYDLPWCSDFSIGKKILWGLCWRKLCPYVILDKDGVKSSLGCK